MARLQILQLPMVDHGDAGMETPFLLIIDEVQNAEALRESLAGAKDLSGARGILAFDETVDIPANELPGPLLVGGSGEAPAGMSYVYDEADQPPLMHGPPAYADVRTIIATLPSGERARTAAIWRTIRMALDKQSGHLRDALGLDNDESIDITAAATVIRRERDAFGDAIGSVRRLHRAIEDPHHPVGQQGLPICGACSVLDPAAMTWLVPHPCATVKALDAPPEPETQGRSED